MKHHRLGAIVIAISAAVLLNAGGASAGSSPTIDVTATGSCDGSITVDYATFLLDGHEFIDGNVIFTIGSTQVAVIDLDDVPVVNTETVITGSITEAGFAPGDVVIIDVRWTMRPSGFEPTGVTTVEMPTDCPTITVSTTTEAPNTTEGFVEDTMVTTSDTLPATGAPINGARGYAVAALLAGAAMIAGANARRRHIAD
jgi:hypothetical protein